MPDVYELVVCDISGEHKPVVSIKAAIQVVGNLLTMLRRTQYPRKPPFAHHAALVELGSLLTFAALITNDC